MRPEYGPTLGRLLAPWWHGSSRLLRAAVIAACVALLAVAVGLVLTLENARYSRGGSVPFSFSYRGLQRVPAGAGEYVKVQSRYADGALKYSFAVAPLTVPPYTGNLSGVLPIVADRYIAALGARLPDFVLAGEGRARVNTVAGYDVLYTTTVEGRPMFGRNILLLPPRAGARQGVVIEMLTSPTASAHIETPLEIATTGVLLRPLRTFTFE